MEGVARDLGVKPQTVLEMEARLANQDVAFEAQDSDDDEITAAPASYLPDVSMEPAALLEKEDTTSYNRDRLFGALDDLDDRSRTIVESRWLSEKKKTLHELAAEYGVSAERIRQIEKNAMIKLRGQLEA